MPDMNEKKYTFENSVAIPQCPIGWTAFLDIVEENGEFQPRWRRLEDWPIVQSRSTNALARLCKSLTNDMRDLPQFGKVTLEFGEFLYFSRGNMTKTFDVDEWVPIQ